MVSSNIQINIITSVLQKRKLCDLTVFFEGFAAPVLSARDFDIWKPSLKIFPREVKEARTTHRDGQWNEILSVGYVNVDSHVEFAAQIFG